VAVFSGGDRIITSQNFKGGRITSIFGGSKINLMNSKLAEGPQVLDTMSVFGGSTIIVPADWTVRVEVVAIFGGFSDRRERMPNIVYDQNTMLVIKGMAIFGGGEVKTFGVR
jgi:predicted membrane protein